MGYSPWESTIQSVKQQALPGDGDAVDKFKIHVPVNWDFFEIGFATRISEFH